MPDPARLLATLRRAVTAFRATPGRTGRMIELQGVAEVLVAGDLHGNLENFSKLIRLADLANHPARHLIVQELIHGSFRYPDSSDKSHQMLDVLSALKCQFPHQVHFLLGNHELCQWTGRQVGKGEEMYNDLFFEGVRFAYGDQLPAIYAGYMDVMAAAALAIRTPNRVLLSHSLPEAKYLGSFDRDVFYREELSQKDVAFGGPAYAVVWGRDTREETARTYLQQMEADLLITGHVPCDQGFHTPNAVQLILDSLGTPACYCLFPTDRELSLGDLTERVRVL